MQTVAGGPFIYEHFGKKHTAHWERGRIFGIGNVGKEGNVYTTITGLTREEAEVVCAALRGETVKSESAVRARWAELKESYQEQMADSGGRDFERLRTIRDLMSELAWVLGEEDVAR